MRAAIEPNADAIHCQVVAACSRARHRLGSCRIQTSPPASSVLLRPVLHINLARLTSPSFLPSHSPHIVPPTQSQLLLYTMTILRRSPHALSLRRAYTTASARKLTVGIRREDPTRIWERRCPLTPDAVHELVHKDGVDVLIQPCERRVFTANDFIKVRPRLSFSPANSPLMLPFLSAAYVYSSGRCKASPHSPARPCRRRHQGDSFTRSLDRPRSCPGFLCP